MNVITLETALHTVVRDVNKARSDWIECSICFQVPGLFGSLGKVMLAPCGLFSKPLPHALTFNGQTLQVICIQTLVRLRQKHS